MKNCEDVYKRQDHRCKKLDTGALRQRHNSKLKLSVLIVDLALSVLAVLKLIDVYKRQRLKRHMKRDSLFL